MNAFSGRSVSRTSFRAACHLRQQTRTRSSERGCASEKAVDIPARALSRSGSTVGGGFGHPLSPAPRAPVAVLSGCQEEPTPSGWRRQARLVWWDLCTSRAVWGWDADLVQFTDF